MAKLKARHKSGIIALIIIIVNFAAYLSFRFFIAQEVSFVEGLLFTLYDTLLELIIVTPVSFLFFKTMK